MSNMVKYGKYTPEALEEEQKQLEGGGDIIKIVVGQNILRILPPPVGRNSPYVIAWRHFVKIPGVEKIAVFTCPRHHEKRLCKACAVAEELHTSGNVMDAKMAKDIFPQKQIFCNAVLRKNQDQGPKTLRITKTVKEQLDMILSNPDMGGDYTDPVDGFDVCINRKGTKQNDTEYKTVASRKNTPLHQDPVVMNDWIESQPNLAKYLVCPTQSEMEELLTGLGGAAANAGAVQRHGSDRQLESGRGRQQAQQPAGGGRTAEDDVADAEFETFE